MDFFYFFFFFQAEDGIRDKLVTGVQTCALPISLINGISTPEIDAAIAAATAAGAWGGKVCGAGGGGCVVFLLPPDRRDDVRRSEEHTSELQSLAYLVCRLLLEKKKKPA